MPLFRLGQSIVFFAHIPKTGGSSVEVYFSKLGAMALRYGATVGWSRCTPQHMHRAVYEHFVPSDFYDYAFTIVRHPVQRIISQYRQRYRWAHRSGAKVPTFSVWLKGTFELYKKNAFLLDNHIRPQTQYIGDNIAIFRIEDGLDRAIASVCRRVGIENAPTVIPQIRRTSDSVPYQLHDEDVDLIFEFYREDFALLGYPRLP